MAARREPSHSILNDDWEPQRSSHDSRVEASSDRFPDLVVPAPITDLESLRIGDKGLYDSVQDVLGALRNEMLPSVVQHLIVEAMAADVRREIVQAMAGLDASILMTFKNQIKLIDSVLARVINADGSARIKESNELGVTAKDAMNMSLKVVSVMTRDLPKIYTLAKVQMLEQALFKVIET